MKKAVVIGSGFGGLSLAIRLQGAGVNVTLLEKREQIGTRKTRKLRATGRIPAVVYGHKETPESVHVSAEQIHKAIKEHARTFNLDVAGKKQQVMFKDLQWDHLGMEILHIDFLRVSAGERVEVHIPIEFKGEIAAGSAGVFEHPLQSLTAECPALSQPEAIRVDISALNIGDAITVADLTLPAGVKALDAPETVVAQVVQPAGEAAEEEDAEGGEGAEPEKIGGTKEEEESEGE